MALAAQTLNRAGWDAMKIKSQYVRKQVVKAAFDKTKQLTHGDKGKQYVILVCNGVSQSDILKHDHIAQATYYYRLVKAGAPSKLADMCKFDAVGYDTYQIAQRLYCLDAYHKAKKVPVEEFENESNVLVRGPMNTLPYIFVFPKRTKLFDNCSVCVAWGEIADQNVPIQDIARILDVFQRWLDTPVAKRIPEKKYYLRAVEDHTVRYVCDICVGTDTCVKFQFGSKTEFSEDHLKSLR